MTAKNTAVPWGEWPSLRQAFMANPDDSELLLNLRARQVFATLRARCLNPKNARYQNYGGRGIEVKVTLEDFVPWYCDRVRGWKYRGVRDMPSIDRKDNNGHYELENMCIVTRSENSKKLYQDRPERMRDVLALAHTSNKIPVQVAGKRFGSIKEAASFFEVDCGTILGKIEKYFGEPSQDRRRSVTRKWKLRAVIIQGKVYRSVNDAANKLGRSTNWVKSRVDEYLGPRGSSIQKHEHRD